MKIKLATKKHDPLETRCPGETALPSSPSNIKSNFDLATIKCQLNNEKALFIPMFKILPYCL